MRPGVLVDAAAPKALEPKSGDAPLGALGLDETAELLSREGGVRPQAGLDRRGPVRAAAVHGKEERDPSHEVRRHDPEQCPTFGVRFADELHVAEPEVAKAAVDQLRRGARRGGAEVAAVDERDAEAGAGRFVRDAGADDPAADDEQVEGRAREFGARCVAPVCC